VFLRTELHIPYIRERADKDDTATSPSPIGIHIVLTEIHVCGDAIDLCDNYGHLAALQIPGCVLCTVVVAVGSSGDIDEDDVLREKWRIQIDPTVY